MKHSLGTVGQARWSLRSSMRAALAITLVATCAGCSTPSASERFYALSDGSSSTSAPVAASTAASTATSTATSTVLPGIVISAVTVPELVDRPQIVTRDGANRVNVAEQQLWAESLKNGIGRVLAVRLARTLADAGRPARVAAYPQTSIANPDVRVTIDVQRFDAMPGGDAVIDVLWSVRRTSDDSIRSGRTVATRPITALTYDDTVRAWSEALDVLNKDIAAVVVQSDSTQPASVVKQRR